MQLKNTIFALLFTILLFACNQQTEIFIGSWDLNSITLAGDVIKAEDLDNPSYSFHENHTYEIVVKGSTEQGTWQKEGDYLILEDFNNEGVQNKLKIIELTPQKIIFSTGSDENISEVVLVKN